MVPKVLVSTDFNLRALEIGKILSGLSFDSSHPDLLYLEEGGKLGVEASKRIREFLSLKPFSAKNKVVVVESSHNLTMEAQNALLKTLEEPPENSVIILGVDREELLLPTVLSRCQVIRIKNHESRIMEKGNFSKDIEKLIGSPVEERFEYVEKLEEKEEFLRALVFYFREKLAFHAGVANLEFSQKLLEAEEWQKANVNMRAILEYLMLEMPSLD